MRIFKIPRTALYVGVMAVIGLTGFQRGTEATAAEPVPNSPRLHVANSTGVKNSVPAIGPALKVNVSLSPGVAKQAAPEDVVYIFARATNGPRMPLAIVRKQVKDLPITVVLDDSHGMNSQMKLSSVPEVVVVARVSKSGLARPQNGDLEGTSAPVTVGAKTISISIAKVLTDLKAPDSPHGYR